MESKQEYPIEEKPPVITMEQFMEKKKEDSKLESKQEYPIKEKNPVITMEQFLEKKKEDSKLDPLFNDTIKKLTFISKEDAELISRIPISTKNKIKVIRDYMLENKV